MPAQQTPVVLVVDPDPAAAAELQAAVNATGHDAIAHTDFQAARDEMRLRELSAIVANVRLGAYNGIHLAYAAKQSHPDLRVMIYATQQDALLAREAQRAGAFYERRALVPHALHGFLAARLPPGDRRSVATLDRRSSFRGGRRATDVSPQFVRAT